MANVCFLVLLKLTYPLDPLALLLEQLWEMRKVRMRCDGRQANWC